nr:crosslink repair DNA glycosylase YcaQ family protein [Streptomyces sp. NTH33]
MATRANPPVLGIRALNRTTPERQLRRAPRSRTTAEAAVRHLVGFQAQNVKPPCFVLAARIADFDPQELSSAMAGRTVPRPVTLRSTVHTHTADDCLTLRPLVQAARDREPRQFRTGPTGVDEMVISLAAKGLTTGEVQAHLAEVYGAEVSRQTISTITDKVLDGMAEWQNRPRQRRRIQLVVATPACTDRR